MKKPLYVLLMVAGLYTIAGASAQDVSPAAKTQEAAADPASTQKPVRSIPNTLMFTTDELNDIQNRMASINQDGAPAENNTVKENAVLYLSTIVYYGPEDWTIWVNGKPIGPHEDFPTFQVTDISPRYVELLVPLSAQGMRPVRLEPNQSFIAKSGTVVEGSWRD